MWLLTNIVSGDPTEEMCLEKTNANITIVKNMFFKGELDLADINREEKCFFKCVLEAFHIFKNGKLNKTINY